MAGFRWKTGTVAAAIALLPTACVVLFLFVGGTGWAALVSLTSSKMLANWNFVGFQQYATLFSNPRWLTSLANMVIFGLTYIGSTLVVGFLLAIFLDQRVKGESVFRTIFLYSYATSFIVVGLVWRWIFNPGMGIQDVVRDLGFASFTFDWIVNQRMAIFTIVIAAIWHGAGLVMVIALAGIRGVDAEIWKALKVDGVPAWRAYLHVILPTVRGSILTAAVLMMIGVVRLYDLVVAMTNGGPGSATEVPAKFIVDNLFERQNIGLATAASTSLLVMLLAVIVPWLLLGNARRRSRA
ncbi:MAG: sugar ABC transporter permease [Rhizobiales bacterium]|nr:sugar ABC transporter permease [Hyphomicrobiales bacterium]OJU35452.1 MAG: sugar ABC transporter permease [Rhizobiales bacterium 68-8]